jgi:small subunit ribosomal protein S3
MKERIFIQKAKEHVKLEEFIRKQFAEAKVSEIVVQHTPVVTRIILYTTTPGLVIGSGGDRIRETAEVLKKEFAIENPQIDVQRIDNPDLDAQIVAQTIAASIENGMNVKRLGEFYLRRIMDSGAVGCEIVFAGKFGGQRGKKQRFIAGYLKKCGDTAMKYVEKGFAVATPKLGNTGVTVKIMLTQPETLKIKKEAPAVPAMPAVPKEGAAKKVAAVVEEAKEEKEEAKQEAMEEKTNTDLEK